MRRILCFYTTLFFLLAVSFVPADRQDDNGLTAIAYVAEDSGSNSGIPSHWTRHGASASVWAEETNSYGDQHEGYYSCSVELNGDYDWVSESYVGGTSDYAHESDFYPYRDPEDVDGSGVANAYICGTCAVAHAYYSGSL